MESAELKYIKQTEAVRRSKAPISDNKSYITDEIKKGLINSGDLEQDIKQSVQSIRKLLDAKRKLQKKPTRREKKPSEEVTILSRG